ncbi:MAG: phosphoribosylformylglycinamidine cyclo-ligase [Candidatus Omnitrophica bacterium]|nr:phosphoribosylformylglycinamidine cyclo-ligase [Candidatus Omnitrophota bacterium]MDD5352908.1 phosphoribosylformylglycinamidine cyclo-ligase [Candidatus Omnitrophota bacterium]MDD5550507.1 phosphoribosylformylglycinamidine cyclo-ligase [Candidatus Omnitrophota bacterium]
MKRKPLTYKQSGVDIKKADSLIEDIKQIVRSADRPGVLRGIGSFGGFFKLAQKYKNPVLVSSSDGVGTKLKIAVLVNKHDTIGIDLVAMNVNDILCCGAEPLFFLDYLGCSKLESSVFKDIIKGVSEGCKQAGCALIGGETAEMPGMYQKGEYDLAGFCVGVVEENKIIDGSGIKSGDVVVGLASNGLHSNGFSLVRKAFSQDELKKMSKELLEPTRIYVKPVLSLLYNNNIKGIAHITGGAFYDKIKRIIPKNLNIEIDSGSWPIPEIFRLIQIRGNIQDKEMCHTFNMGIGMVLVVNRNAAEKIIRQLAQFGLQSWIIGRVVKGNKKVIVK